MLKEISRVRTSEVTSWDDHEQLLRMCMCVCLCVCCGCVCVHGHVWFVFLQLRMCLYVFACVPYALLDCPKLLDAKKIEQLQEQCMETLDEYCRSRFPEQKLRFSKILLRLSAVRSITTETRDYIIQHRQHSNVQVDSFVLEMLGVEVADEPPNSA